MAAMLVSRPARLHPGLGTLPALADADCVLRRTRLEGRCRTRVEGRYGILPGEKALSPASATALTNSMS
jgi:hypothetical protein